MKTSVLTSLVAAAAMLTGCASGPKLNYNEYAGEPVKSFYMSNFDGWSAVSKDQLVVWAGMNKAYLLNVEGYCPDLQFAHTIAVTILITSLIVAVILHKSRVVGPLINLGVATGLAMGVTSTWLIWQLAG